MMTWQQYLLVCLMEECAEVQHIAAKSLRFGINDYKPNTGDSNHEELVKECNDIFAILEMLEEEGIKIPQDKDLKEYKKARVKKYAQHSIEIGALQCLPNKT